MSPRGRTRAALLLAGTLGLAAAALGAPDDGPENPGRWRRYETRRFDPDLTEEQRSAIERLESLGYLSGSVPASREGSVTLLRPERVQDGLNLYTSGHEPGAWLMDLDGTVRHEWHLGFREIWPDYPVAPDHPSTAYWRRAYLLEGGDLLVIFEGLGLARLDRDSNLIWANPLRAHHDLQVLENGDLWVLTRQAHIVPRVNETRPILEDFVTVLNADGEEIRSLSVLACLESSGFADLWLDSGRTRGDIFHTNSLKVLTGDDAVKIAGENGSSLAGAEHRAWMRAGNVLLSLLYLDAIVVLDPRAERVVWAHRGTFRQQHDARVLGNGNVLLFDNGTARRGSAVLELDPDTGDTVWEYRGTPDLPFWSERCGTARRLPNGNTLVTESDNGRAIEVDPGGELVWEFVSPHRAGADREYVATLFDVVRIPRAAVEDWLQ